MHLTDQPFTVENGLLDESGSVDRFAVEKAHRDGIIAAEAIAAEKAARIKKRAADVAD